MKCVFFWNGDRNTFQYERGSYQHLYFLYLFIDYLDQLNHFLTEISEKDMDMKIMYKIKKIDYNMPHLLQNWYPEAIDHESAIGFYKLKMAETILPTRDFLMFMHFKVK